MDLSLFLKGILMGFGMAIPVGPIGIICIRKTLTEGRKKGLTVGLGAATADMLFAGVAAFGLTIISDTLISQKILIRLIGGALILYIGIRTFYSKPSASEFGIHTSGYTKLYFSTLFLTITNPFTIFAFIAIFATFGLGAELNFFSALTLVTGVFTGSALWFVFLSSFTSVFRMKFDMTRLRRVNKIAGVLIILSAVFTVASLFY
ncbi:MAG: LysE family transporter [Ignavibacteria bacterium]|nr:LysE family transporter [Ignavibacteria bacterium]